MPRLFCSLTLALLLPSLLLAQQEKKSRFKPIPDQAREAIAAAVPKQATAEPAKERRVLVFYRCGGFVHQSIPFGNFAVQTLGEKTGAFQVDLAEDYEAFTPDNLAKYDCILLNNTTHMQFPEASQLNAFLDFISKGKGLAGFHAASDNFGRHPEALALVGGIFNGHPWGAGGTWAFKLDDPANKLNQAFSGKGFWHQDEIYQYKPESYAGPETLRVLVSLDMSKNTVSDRIKDGPREVPVSWVRKAGEGRVFYTNFGHRPETFQNPVILQHMIDGIQYAIGDLAIDDAPTGKSSQGDVALAPEKK
ncbi:MAG: glycosyl hydrolase [Rhodopirellula sp.]|nr:glycosyl hydrolase [Rhodopirellula sp.]